MHNETAASIRGLVNTKLRQNTEIIEDNADLIEVALRDLRAAALTGNMDGMSEASKVIVDNGIGCRSRLQFMRGCWAVLRDARDCVTEGGA